MRSCGSHGVMRQKCVEEGSTIDRYKFGRLTSTLPVSSSLPVLLRLQKLTIRISYHKVNAYANEGDCKHHGTAGGGSCGVSC